MRVAPLAGLLLFSLVALAQVFSRGVCCADDANIALTAKNVADGLGYVTTLPQEAGPFRVIPFAPTISTGPAVVLPAAALISLVGNTHWAPGLAVVTVWSLVLAALGWRLRVGAVAAFVFVCLCYWLTSHHPEHWYAALGEVPAALWFLLGFALAITHAHAVATGLALSFAVLSKLSALMSVGILGGFLLAWHWREWRWLMVMGIAFALPLVAFEVWRSVSSGSVGDAWDYFNKYAVVGSTDFGARNAALWDRFRLGLPMLAVGFAGVWWLIRSDTKLRRMYLVLVTAIVAHSIWWFVLSIGWPRYYVFALPLIAAVFSLPFLQPLPRRTVAVYSLLLALATVPGWARLSAPFDKIAQFGGRPFVPTRETRALREVADLLAPIVANNGIILTQAWTTAIDIEYTLDTHRNFYANVRDRAVGQQPFWIALNTRFLALNDAELSAVLAKCEQQRFEIYIVAECQHER